MLSLSRWITVFVLLLTAVVGSVASSTSPGAVSNQTVYDFRLGQAALGPGPALPIGSMAPDFSLPTLQSYLPEGKNPAVQTVRLSTFRGKKSVVLLFTGHT